MLVYEICLTHITLRTKINKTAFYLCTSLVDIPTSFSKCIIKFYKIILKFVCLSFNTFLTT